MQMAGQCKYSCETAAETFQWIKAIVDFLKPFTFLISAHVVNFFTDKLWEAVDKDWIDSLRNEPIENLLLIPSGVVQVCFLLTQLAISILIALYLRFVLSLNYFNYV